MLDEHTNGVLILHGNKDFIVPYSLGVKLHSYIKTSKLHTIKGAGHTFKIKSLRKEIMQEITEFMEVNKCTKLN